MIRRAFGHARRVGVLGLCTAVAVLVAATASGAATSVNVACGDSAGLVAAVNTVNAGGGGSINLAAGCTYSLTTRNNTVMGGNGLPVVVSPITINGKGATIAGNNSNFRIIAIDGNSGGALTLNGVAIIGGHIAGMMVGGAGGGILNLSGNLTLNSATVTHNFASDAGGGIANGFGATATLNKSEVSWNTVPQTGSGGGGMLGIAASLTLNQSLVDHNTGPGGGGIASGNGNGGGPGSSITLNKSVISNNTATNPNAGGGGISNGGTLVSNNSEITGNTATASLGGGLFNHSAATLNKTVVSGNSAPDGVGGGIANTTFDAALEATLVLNNSQVTGNIADGGAGGIFNFSFDPAGTSSVTLNHSNVSANTPDNCEPPGSVSGCTN
jgi:hypothetical protein